MKTVYPTKVSITLILIISLIMGCILISLAVSSKWIPFFINLLLYVSLVYLMVSIKYEINESQLIIHQAMGKMVIDINTIKSIESSFHPGGKKNSSVSYTPSIQISFLRKRNRLQSLSLISQLSRLSTVAKA